MSKNPVVKESKMALNQFKEEIANELGISIPNTNLSSNMTSRQAGKTGGKLGVEMTKRLVESATRNMTYGNNSQSQDLD